MSGLGFLISTTHCTPPSARLFDQIEVKMTRFVMEALSVDRDRADFLRDHYWKTYGTTLAGLMKEHDVDPGPYLTDVHEIDLTHLQTEPTLAAHISALPGRKIVFTNGCEPYAQRVLKARGLDNIFDAVYGVEHANFHPKPEQAAFDTVFARDDLHPGTAAMFEDDARNLKAPHAMGMQTIHVAPQAAPAPHIHHHTPDLTAFLSQLV